MINQPKNELTVFQGDIITPDFFNILVGENEDEILIWQEASSGWENQIKS